MRMVLAYGVRGSIGANYWLTPHTSLGAYWQTKKSFNFQDAAVFDASVPIIGGKAFDVAFDHPQNFGIGIADNSLIDGRLLLAVDAIYKRYSDADFLKALYTDQWAIQVGSQYAMTERVRLRLGYAWNENPMKSVQLNSIGGVNLPDGVPAVRYVQGQFAAITQHRITTGVGVRDVLPGIDLDVFGGYAFDATDKFAETTVNVSGNYWIGFGTTWRFGSRAARDETEPVE